MPSSYKNSLDTVQIETTDHCNHKCVMCARTEAPPRRPRHMTLPRFRSLINKLASTKARTFIGHNLGEPLLTPRYMDMLEYFDRRFQGKRFIFNTNGSKLSPDFTERFLALQHNKYQINFSIDAASNSAYRKIHNASLTPVRQKIIGFLKDFIKQNNKHIEVVLNFIVTPANALQQNKFMAQWKPFLKQNPRIKLRFNPLAWNNNMKQKYNYDIWTRAHPDAAIFKLNKPRQKACHKPWRMLSIKANGDLGLCCYDLTTKLHLGNIFNSSLKSLLHKARYRRIKRDFLRKDFRAYPLCYFCHG